MVGPIHAFLRHPFVNLTAGWAPHRNRDARKAFEQHPTRSSDQLRLAHQYGGHWTKISANGGTPFGNGLEDQPGRQARICARASALQRIVRAWGVPGTAVCLLRHLPD